METHYYNLRRRSRNVLTFVSVAGYEVALHAYGTGKHDLSIVAELRQKPIQSAVGVTEIPPEMRGKAN